MGHKYFENVSFRFPLDSASEPADCHVQVVLQSCLTRESCLTECCMEAVPLKEAQRNFQGKGLRGLSARLPRIHCLM